MSTSSLIGKVLDDSGKCKVIYCHFDGYIENPGVGWTLNKYYRNEKDVDKLLNLGNLSFLGEVPEDDPELWKDSEHSNKCRTYKGRGETGEEAQLYKNPRTAIKKQGQSYNYFYIDGKWYCIPYNSNKIIDIETGENINNNKVESLMKDIEFYFDKEWLYDDNHDIVEVRWNGKSLKKGEKIGPEYVTGFNPDTNTVYLDEDPNIDGGADYSAEDVFAWKDEQLSKEESLKEDKEEEKSLHYHFSVYSLDYDGSEMEFIDGFDNFEEAKAKAERVYDKTGYHAHIVYVPDFDPDDDPDTVNQGEYEDGEVIWSTLEESLNESTDEDKKLMNLGDSLKKKFKAHSYEIDDSGKDIIFNLNIGTGYDEDEIDYSKCDFISGFKYGEYDEDNGILNLYFDDSILNESLNEDEEFEETEEIENIDQDPFEELMVGDKVIIKGMSKGSPWEGLSGEVTWIDEDDFDDDYQSIEVRLKFPTENGDKEINQLFDKRYVKKEYDTTPAIEDTISEFEDDLKDGLEKRNLNESETEEKLLEESIDEETIKSISTFIGGEPEDVKKDLETLEGRERLIQTIQNFDSDITGKTIEEWVKKISQLNEEKENNSHIETIEMPHEEYTSIEDIIRINNELDQKAKEGKLIGLRKEKDKLMLAEPAINGIWTLFLNDKGGIIRITLW